MTNSEGIIRQIHLKQGTPEHIFTALCNKMEEHGKFLSSHYEADETPVIICQFDDILDFVAMMVALGK